MRTIALFVPLSLALWSCQVTTTGTGGQSTMTFGLAEPSPTPSPTPTPTPTPPPTTVNATATQGVPPPVTGTQVGGSTCTARLTVQQLNVQAGCTVDSRLTAAPGTLQYPCGGGAATADFGNTRFQGAVQGGSVQLSIETRFHFTDGCDWSTKQEITGSLNAGTLAYRYTEEPLAGQRGCARACVATASVVAR